VSDPETREPEEKSAREEEGAVEDRPEEPGAEGGSQSPEADTLPGMPATGADSELGDTDQHSSG
jgi:hypothetical protein